MSPIALHLQMPSRLSSLRRYASRLTRPPFVCPSCAFHLSAAPSKPIQFRSTPSGRRRQASTVQSATAINASRHIRPQLRELYDCLGHLQVQAANHVNLSRLRLAQSSLEAREAIVRLAREWSPPDMERR